MANEAGLRKACKRKTNFVQVSNALAQDSTLSFATRGMLLYLLSKPDDWVGRPRDIEREGDISPARRRRMIIEAERAGYITYRKMKDQKTGRFDCWYEVYDEPIPVWERTKSWETGRKLHPPEIGGVDGQSPPPMFPLGGEPLGGQPPSGNMGGIIILEGSKKELTKKEAADSAAASRIELLKNKLNLEQEQAEFIISRHPHCPDSLLEAAISCWLEPSGAKRRWSEGNPIRFIQGVLSNPGAFGVKVINGQFIYQQKLLPDQDKKAKQRLASLELLKGKIREMRVQGLDDRTIYSQLWSTVNSDELRKQAFQELANE